MELVEPHYITTRRLLDRNEFLKQDNDQLRFEAQTWPPKLVAKDQKIVEQANVINARDSLLATRQAEWAAKEAEWTAREADWMAKEAEWTVKIEDFERRLSLARIIAHDLDSYRNRKVARLIERVFDRTDVSKNLPSSFQRLKDDSLIFLPSLKGFILQPSVSLHRVPYISYRIQLKQVGLCGISFAPALDFLLHYGLLGIEVVSPAKQIVVHTYVSASRIEREIPVHFSFPPLGEAEPGNFELRVFARDLEVPLRIYEWRKYPLVGLGPVRALPFCGLDFCSRSADPDTHRLENGDIR
jgi:hypothetical protein